MKLFLLLSLVFGSLLAHSQDADPFTPSGEAKYFDFWEGTWYLIRDDGSLDSNFYFKVTRSVNPSAFLEEWKFGKEGQPSLAVRAWDKTNQKWGFIWVSPNGLYQVWDTKKVWNDWYIYKNFTIKGDSYLSRQGFIPQPDGTVIRISEKTYDEKKWELRFKQRLKKM